MSIDLSQEDQVVLIRLHSVMSELVKDQSSHDKLVFSIPKLKPVLILDVKTHKLSLYFANEMYL